MDQKEEIGSGFYGMYRSNREMKKTGVHKNETRKLEGGGDEEEYYSSSTELLSWPPKSYTCSFCKREFKSAQGLGGHMNVHRRERARLRLYQPLPSPSWVVSQGYSPKLKSSSPNLSVSSSSSSMPWEKKRKPLVVHRVEDLMKGKKMMISAAAEDDDLEMEDPKEALDLELRLGCF